jgi:hypothetical protein
MFRTTGKSHRRFCFHVVQDECSTRYAAVLQIMINSLFPKLQLIEINCNIKLTTYAAAIQILGYIKRDINRRSFSTGYNRIFIRPLLRPNH